MDTELSAAIRALTRLDQDAALARLHLVAGGTEEEAAEIMRGRDRGHVAAKPNNVRYERI
ncbi:hypothetical protein [Streptosporangium sp. G12]